MKASSSSGCFVTVTRSCSVRTIRSTLRCPFRLLKQDGSSAGSLGFFKRSEPAEAGPHPLLLTERGRIFGCAARPVRAFRRNVRRTHGQDTRQASREAVSRHGPASYCPEGYTPHSPWWGAEACRARKAPSYFDGNARASSAPGDTPFASGFMGKAQGKSVFPKTEGCFRGWDGIWFHCCEIRADHMVFPLKGREAGYASYCMFLWLIRDISQ